jgi:hypothetical protein
VGSRSGSAQVVTFDISQPTVRRHSSPASSARRRDSIAVSIPAASTDYQLNGSAMVTGGPGTSPTDFRSASASVVTGSVTTSADALKSGRDVGAGGGNVYVNRCVGVDL